MTKVSVSLLSGDMSFATLESRVKELEKCADSVHFDVMDGVYNPNDTWKCQGPDVIERLRKMTDVPFIAHLMVSNPMEKVGMFRACDEIIFHCESCSNHGDVIRKIKSLGRKPGIAIEPDTNESAIDTYLGDVSTVLVMTVKTGYPGQGFIDETEKIARLNKIRKDRGLSFEIAVDGGINAATGKLCAAAGADTLASASYILNSKSYSSAIDSLK